MKKPAIRIWTRGIETDTVVCDTLGGRRVGSGYSFRDSASDLDFEYKSVETRELAFERASNLLGTVIIRMERR